MRQQAEIRRKHMEGKMHYSDYLREQAAYYRALARHASDVAQRAEYLELAEVCEEVAGRVDDLRSSG